MNTPANDQAKAAKPAPAGVLLELVYIPSPVPPDIRLRRALKCLLRSFGLRCTGVRGIPAAPVQAPAAPTLQPSSGPASAPGQQSQRVPDPETR